MVSDAIRAVKIYSRACAIECCPMSRALVDARTGSAGARTIATDRARVATAFAGVITATLARLVSFVSIQGRKISIGSVKPEISIFFFVKPLKFDLIRDRILITPIKFYFMTPVKSSFSARPSFLRGIALNLYHVLIFIDQFITLLKPYEY